MTDLMQWLASLGNDPLAYLIIFFIFCVAAAIILPIPVELGLLFGEVVPYPIKAIVLGLGKGVGSVAVFEIGMKLEPKIRSWSRWRWFKWLFEMCEKFVAKYNYYALYVILSIPLMLDTVPIYIFSLANKNGKALEVKWFAVTNFFAGVTRAAILWLLLEALGWNLFG
jgi:membrane protein YqaA with SNARE-associated domain